MGIRFSRFLLPFILNCHASEMGNILKVPITDKSKTSSVQSPGCLGYLSHNEPVLHCPEAAVHPVQSIGPERNESKRAPVEQQCALSWVQAQTGRAAFAPVTYHQRPSWNAQHSLTPNKATIKVRLQKLGQLLPEHQLNAPCSSWS